MAQPSERPDLTDIIHPQTRSIRKSVMLLLVLAGIVLAAFYGFREWYVDDIPTAAAPQWERFTVQRGDLTITLTTSGTAAARKSAELSFSSGGIVVAVEASLGDQVAEGDVLARLDDRDAQNGLRISKDNLMEAELRLRQLLEPPYDLMTAKNNLTEAKLRLTELKEPPSAAALLDAEKAITAAKSQLASTKLNRETALEPPTPAEIAVADAAIAQAQSSLDTLMTPPTKDEIATADATVQQNQLAAISADRAVRPAYADLRVIQRSFCSLSQIQPSILIDDAESLWQTVDARYISLELDKNAFVHGTNSLRIGLPRFQEAKTIIAKKTFPTLDLSEFDHIEFWVRSDTSVESGYFQLIIDDSEWFNTILEVLEIPALEEELWAHVSIPIAKLSSDIGVQTVGIRFSPAMLIASPNQTLWLDEVRAFAQNTICKNTSLPLSEDSLKLLIGKVDEATSADEAVATRSRDFIRSNSSYVKALDNRDVAAANLLSATAKRAALDEGPLEHEINQARASLKSAIEKRGEMDDQLSPSEIAQLQAAIEDSEAALSSAEGNKEDLISGPSENDIKLQELNIARAQQAVEQAEETLADMELKAPFSGQIGAVNVSEASRVAASTSAFLLVDLSSVGVDLTVSESDFIGLTPGGLGVAVFDAIPGQPFILKLTGITSVPQITQGVVTYPVQADFLTMDQATQALPGLRPLLRGLGTGVGIGTGTDLEALRRCAAEQVGREVSSPSDLSPEEMVRIREKCLPGGSGRESASEPGAPERERVKPAVGMNASVTVLLEVKEDVLLVPARAVRTIEGREVVSMPGRSPKETTYRTVTTGSTDGEQTEITTGLNEGEVVLVGSTSTGSAGAPTQPNRDTGPPPGGSRRRGDIR